MGPGATRAENALILAASFLGAAIALLAARLTHVSWTAWQYAVAAFLALDLFGGVATNAAPCAQRWYHRKGQGPAAHFGFVALHLAHLALVSWLFLGWDLAWTLETSALLLGGAVLVLAAPASLRRSVALLTTALAITIALALPAQPPGLTWFLPVLFLKLLAAHLVHTPSPTPATARDRPES